MTKQRILGISGLYHDSAAALTIGDEVVAAVQEERFSRKKHDASFPIQAIEYCLAESGLTMAQIDAVVFYDKPLLKFERLLETYYAFSPKGLVSFFSSIPVWLKEKMFLKKLIHDELGQLEGYDKKKATLLFPEHHLSHAASAFYPSPYEEAAILTLDGVGEWATSSICHGKGSDIEVLKEMRFPHSLGLLYSAFTYFLGFKVNSGEYKLMGLAPYADREGARVKQYLELIEKHIAEVLEDGSVWLNQKYFNYATGLRMIREAKWKEVFGFARRDPEQELEQRHCDLAMAIQLFTEKAVIGMAKTAQELTGAKNLCLAGGVALNCVANGKLQNTGLFENVYIQPAAGDAGGALGAALAGYYIHFGNERKPLQNAMDGMKGSYLGPSFSNEEVSRMAGKYGAVYQQLDNFEDLCQVVAQKLSEGAAVGWIQGRMEFGPRALGARSILGDARNADMQKKLNLKIKYRESFRPFAPSVLAEDAHEYFDLDAPSPYMLQVHPVAKARQAERPEGYMEADMRTKLYYKRSDIPAVTHIDYSARIQTVHKETNPRYWQLLHAFKVLTGYSLVVNTSFNVRGEPIVCTPEEAYRCFMRTEMEYLVVENCLFQKKEQPEWDNKDHWKEAFKLD